MKITVSRSEASALFDLRGLPEDAHMMVMCMHTTAKGGVLESEPETFDSLLGFISEELAEGMVPASRVSALVSLCKKIEPSCGPWLGS